MSNEELQRYLSYSIQQRASDLYLEHEADHYRLCLRVHHDFFVLAQVKESIAWEWIRILKYQAGLELGTGKQAQTGTSTFQTQDGRKYRLRISVLNDFAHCENVVIRFLYPYQRCENYFFQTSSLVALAKQTKQRGLHLFTGPVGSGKTSLMYRLIQQNFAKAEIICLEDPVEFVETQFLQIQVQKEEEYATTLKQCLRHRPDVLVIGEIRDEITAHYAFRAALSGFRVFASLHAPSLAQVPARLADFGLGEQKQKWAVRTKVYQSLLPSLCPFCGVRCHPRCVHYTQRYRVLFACQEIGEEWNDALRKWWALGVLATETVEQEWQAQF